MKRAEKKLLKKAYCGDGLLRYLLGKMYINVNFRGSIHYLQSNKILAKVVINNPNKFEVKPHDMTNIHYMGTLYEARLFDVFELQGNDAAVEFIKETFKIEKKETPRDIYYRFLKMDYKIPLY